MAEPTISIRVKPLPPRPSSESSQDGRSLAATLIQDIAALSIEHRTAIFDLLCTLHPSIVPDATNNSIEIDFSQLNSDSLGVVRRFVKSFQQDGRGRSSKSSSQIKSPRSSSASKPRSPTKRFSDRMCDSCKTSETPTWREREGTAFCNACGLRFSKLNIRCSNDSCRFVPHHTNLGQPCVRCGHGLVRVSPQ